MTEFIKLHHCLPAFRKDGNGELTLEEITKYLHPGHQQKDDAEWKKLIEEVDKDKNGKVNNFGPFACVLRE